MIKVAINGFGRIGRLAFREMITANDFDVVAINDLTDAETLAYLLKYDTNHRSFHEDIINFEGDEIVIKGTKRIKVYAEKDPSVLPWGELGVDVVLECTGAFTDLEGASKHIEAGAKKVIISAPGKGDMKTIVYNVNSDILDGTETVISAASCTTNCLAPVLKVLEDNIGIVKGYMTTVHAYTNDQVILDVAHKKGIKARRGRAGAANIIPSSTGAAKAVGEVIPVLKGKLTGMSFRVPTLDVSVVDLTCRLAKATTYENIKAVVKKHAETDLKGILGYTEEPVVSTDFIHDPRTSIFDANAGIMLNENFVKLVSWYDNEWGYSNKVVDLIAYMASVDKK